MEEGNWHKFTKTAQEHQMRKKLLATEDRELVEVSLFWSSIKHRC